MKIGKTCTVGKQINNIKSRKTHSPLVLFCEYYMYDDVCIFIPELRLKSNNNNSKIIRSVPKVYSQSLFKLILISITVMCKKSGYYDKITNKISTAI